MKMEFWLVAIIIIAVIVLAGVMYKVLSDKLHLIKNAEENMNRMLVLSLNKMGDMVVRMDIVNDRIYNIFGSFLPDGDFNRKQILAHIHPEDRGQVCVNFKQIIDSGAEVIDIWCRYNYGTEQKENWHDLYIKPSVVKDEHDILMGMNLSISDVTERKQNEKEDAVTAEKFHQLFSISPTGLTLTDELGFVTDANKRIRDIYHIDKFGKQYFQVTSIFSLPPFKGNMLPSDLDEQVSVCEKNDEVDLNKTIYLEKIYTPIKDDNGKTEFIACEVQDVTDERKMVRDQIKLENRLKKANEQLRKMESDLLYLFQNRGIYLWTADLVLQEVVYSINPSYPLLKMTFRQLAESVEDENLREKLLSDSDELIAFYRRPYTSTFKMKNIFDSQDDKIHVYTQSSLPYYDNTGMQTGCYGVMYDVTGTMEKREALRRETEHANLSVKQKSIFMANMSHEIRTPLNAIVGFSQVLETLDEGDERKEVLNIICENSDVLLILINDILDASTMGTSLTIEPKNINFAREFDNICQTLSQRINNPEVDFIVNNSLVDLHINLDMARIQQVIYNFFTNAMKYTSKGYIKLGYRYSVNEGLYIYCEDTGTGIPKDKQSSIFEQFVKLNDFVQGTGLGLNICKTIVEKCGGTIGVNSEEGKGSTFWIKLPVNVVPSDST